MDACHDHDVFQRAIWGYACHSPFTVAAWRDHTLRPGLLPVPIDLYLEHHHHVVCEQMSQGLTGMHVYHAKREPQSTSCLPTMPAPS